MGHQRKRRHEWCHLEAEKPRARRWVNGAADVAEVHQKYPRKRRDRPDRSGTVFRSHFFTFQRLPILATLYSGEGGLWALRCRFLAAYAWPSGEGWRETLFWRSVLHDSNGGTDSIRGGQRPFVGFGAGRGQRFCQLRLRLAH